MVTITRRLPGEPERPREERLVKRVLAYLRVSSENQVERGFSLPTQKAEIQQWCEREFGSGKYTLEFEADEGISGKYGWEPPKRGPRKYRPGLARVVETLTQGGVDYLVVWRLDRIARNFPKQLEFLSEFFYQGSACKFRSVTEQFDLDTVSGELMAQMLGMIADVQRKQIAGNIKSAMVSRRRDGYPTGQIPYGWRRTPRVLGGRTGLEPVPEQVVWVERAYQLAEGGWGVRRIARELERLGAPAPGTTPGWTDQKVWRVLHQPIHAGLIWDGKTTKQGVHWEQRVVEPETFERVSRELQVRKRDVAHRKDKTFQPLWRVARCGTCGTRLTVVDGDGVNYYRCRGSVNNGPLNPPGEAADLEGDAEAEDTIEAAPGSRRGPTGPGVEGKWCPGWVKAAEPIEREVVRLLTEAVQLPAFQRLTADEARLRVLAEGRAEIEARRAEKQRLLRRTEEQLRKLVRLHMEDLVSEEIYREERARLQEEQEEVARELAALEARLTDERGQTKLLEQLREQLPQVGRIWAVLDPEERRLLVQSLTEYVLVERTGLRAARLRVKIHFLPEQVVVLHHSRSRAAGYGAGVEGLSQRDLAFLLLVSEGHSLKEIAQRWQAHDSGIYLKERAIRERLRVDSLAEAVRLAWDRITAEREQLPVDAVANRRWWASWRPSQYERLIQVMEGRARGEGYREIAAAHGISFATARNMEWKVRQIYEVSTTEAAVRCFLQEREQGGPLFARLLQDPELRQQLNLKRVNAGHD